MDIGPAEGRLQRLVQLAEGEGWGNREETRYDGVGGQNVHAMEEVVAVVVCFGGGGGG